MQRRLGLSGVPAFDVNAVCSSFVYSTVIGSRLLEPDDPDGTVLVLGADRWGNTAAASIPLTMADSARKSPFRRGENVLLAAIGGGMTAGAAVLTWY